jgi:Ca-activated chloride channel family protein
MVVRNRGFVRIIVTLCAAVTGGVLALRAQEPQFRSGVRTVPVYVTVKGADGHLINDLPRDKFEIYDDGRKQEITVFSNDVSPIAVVVLLDRSGSVINEFEIVRRAAQVFVGKLRPDDKARVGSFANRVQLDPPEFTSDRDQLRMILMTELQPPGPTPLWNAVSVGMTALLRQQARRVILVFTDGYDSPQVDRQTNATLGELMQRSREEDVMVYGVGLTTNPGTNLGMVAARGSRRGGPPASASRGPDEGLKKLSDESGGGYFSLDSAADLESTFARVADELHHQYALGFTPQRLDGKVHDIEVRVLAPGLTVQARKSYVAPKPKER